MKLKEMIYNNLPIFLQNTVCSLYGLVENKRRYSRDFYGILSELKGSDFWSEKQRINYQKEKLAGVLLMVRKNEYYSTFLDKFTVEDINIDPFSILASLPIIDKSVLLEHGQNMQNTTIDSSIVNTSGTTGTALKLLKSDKDMAAQVACWFRHRSRFGVNFKDESVNFTGKVVVPISQKKPPFWRFNKTWNQHLVNMQHINEANIKEIVGFLNSITPKFYSGYPSIIGDVARLALNAGIPLNKKAKPVVIFTGAENILDWQRDAIIKWTGAELTDLYGLTEGSCNLSKCQHGFYHEDFELCYSELINTSKESGGRLKGELVGTGFFLEAFPLLRYKTGDIAIQMPSDFSCKCGRKGRVYESIEGRVDDFVLTPSGSRVMRFDYLFKDTYGIEQVQVVQSELDKVTFNIKLKDAADKYALESILTERFEKWISSDIHLEFTYLKEIEKSSTGKFKAVVNKLEG